MFAHRSHLHDHHDHHHADTHVEGLEERQLLSLSLLTDPRASLAKQPNRINLQLASFTESQKLKGPFKVAVSWGDTSKPTVFQAKPGKQLPVVSHAYRAAGSYQITETVIGPAKSSAYRSIITTVGVVAKPAAAITPTATSAMNPVPNTAGQQSEDQTMSVLGFIGPARVVLGGTAAPPTGTAAAASVDVPIVSLTKASYSGTVSDATTFQASTIDTTLTHLASDYTYTWDYGDGSPTLTVNGHDASYHVYGKTGNFQVSVIVAGPNGVVSNVATAPVSVEMSAIPDLALWQSHMITAGRNIASIISNPDADTASSLLGEVYYDSERVFLQIADYTHDDSWLVPAQNAEKIYRDQYVLPNNGAVSGYWNFAKGMAMDHLRTGDQTSYDAVMKLSKNAAYAADSGPLAWTEPALRSREVAYNILTMISAEDLGAPHRTRLDQLVGQALGHLDQWFVSKTAEYIQPFMVGLTSDALISWYQKTGDARVLPAIQTALDSMWSTLWDSASQSFLYMDRVTATGGPTPAPDLNLLIAPAYGWLYHMTGDVKYRTEGDQIFAGGVEKAYLDAGKQFDQNYRLSFDYVNWRSQSPLTDQNKAGSLSLLTAAGANGTENVPLAVNLGNFTDTCGSGPWSVSVNWGDGSATANLVATAQGSLPQLTHTYANDGVYTVTEQMVSSTSATELATIRVSIINAAPTLANVSQANQIVRAAGPTLLAAAATDASPNDQASGFTYAWNFGDGTATQSGHGLSQVIHTYQSAGNFVATVTATDCSGSISNTVSYAVTAVNDATIKAIPELALWQSKMLSLGQTYASQLVSGTSVTLTDLDAIQVFYQIADFTGQSSWLTAANNARTIYRDKYVLQNNGSVSGTLDFGTGLATDYLRTGDTKSRDAVIALTQHATYVAVGANVSYLQAVTRSEEVAQGILTELAASDVGAPQTVWLGQLVNLALGHLDQWFVSKTTTNVATYNVAMTCEALIRYADRTNDPRILPAVENAMKSLWTTNWNATASAFNNYDRVSSAGTPAPCVSSNLVVAPVLAWLYDKTANTTYRDEGDSAFASGIKNTNIYSERLFAMSYLWSFDFVYRRSRMPVAATTTPGGQVA